jgi:hypothetical protein
LAFLSARESARVFDLNVLCGSHGIRNIFWRCLVSLRPCFSSVAAQRLKESHFPAIWTMWECLLWVQEQQMKHWWRGLRKGIMLIDEKKMCRGRVT